MTLPLWRCRGGFFTLGDESYRTGKTGYVVIGRAVIMTGAFFASFGRPMIRSARAGFSMIEIMLVVMIMGLVGALSAGRIHAIIVQQRVVRASASLQSDLESAFAIAARNRRPVRISWNSAKMQMGVTDRAGAIYYRRTPLGATYGFSASNVTFSNNPLEIYPNGLAGDTLAIVLSLEGNTRTIVVSRAGMVRVNK